MDVYSSTNYGTIIIFVCLGLIMFIITMINAEIEKRNDKLKYGITSLIFIFGYFLLIISATAFNLNGIFDFAIYISGVVILGRDLISFIIKKNHSNEKAESIRIRCYWTSVIFLYFINTFLSKVSNPKFELVEVYFMLVLLIDLPITYSVNHNLNLYESGIAISTFSFPKKIIPYDEIIPYENIENINIAEYQKNKFIVNIKVKYSKRKSPYEYFINGEGKEQFLSFIKDYVEDDKITYKI